MAAIPDVVTTIKDGALGLVSPLGTQTVACVGVSSLGTANAVTSYSDITTLKAALGTGPLVEAAAHILSVAGGTVVCCKTTTSSAGSNGSVTNAGTGTSALSLTGTPVDSYQASVKVVTGSSSPTNGVATFKYSLDNGRTYSNEISLPTAGTYAVPNTGLTLSFATGTLVAGDVYSWASTGPTFSTSDLNTALDALLADSSTYFLVHAVGVPTNATAGAALSAALEAKLINAETSLYRYVRGVINTEDDTDTNLKSNYASTAFTRTMVVAGYANIVSAVTGAALKRPAAFAVAARAAAVSPSQDLGAVQDGALKGISALLRDEQKTVGLDAARFTTLRTIVGLPGFYVTNPRIMASPTSDFQYLQYGRVMDIASTLNRTALLFYLNSAVRVNKATGLILEQDARSIENRVEGIVRTGTTQPGYASDISVTVDRTVNVLSTQRLSTRLRITPLGYAKGIDAEVGLFNPALVAT